MLIILSSLLTNSSVLSSLLTGSILSSLLRVSCLPAYQMTLNGRVVDVVSEWGSLYILLRDGRVSLRPSLVTMVTHLPTQLIRLEENDTKTKLETLFKKNLYPTAIKSV